MISLPADLAEVLKTVQKNENGKDIAFPDANEELLGELAAAWDKWNQVADTHVRAITEAAQRAMSSMSGPAADSFQQYLTKFAGGDDSHVATTLQSGQAIATSLHGATGAVVDTKNEMVRELQYAKTYMEQNPAGKHDDIANSEGIKQAAAVYHQYVGQVGTHVDGLLRKNATHIADMSGMAKTCSLNGQGASGGSGGAGGAGGYGGAGGADAMAGARTPGGPAGLFGPDGAGNGPGGVGSATPFSLPDAPHAAGSNLDGVGAAGGAPGFGGIGSTGGVGGIGSASGSGGSGGGVGGVGSAGGAGEFGGGGSTGGAAGTPALAPFKLPTPNMPDFGSGGSSGGSSGGAPVFSPPSIGKGSLNLAGLGDLGTPSTSPSSTSHYTPIGSSFTPSPGTTGGGGGSPFTGGFPGVPNIGSYQGSSGGPAARSLTPFKTTGSNPFGSAGGSTARGSLGGAGGSGVRSSAGGSGIGSSSLASRAGGGAGLGAAGGASAKGMSGAAGAGRVGSSGLSAGGAAGRAGGAAGGAGAGAGGHMPGMGGAGRGGGKGDKKGANRFLSPTRFGAEGEEDEELMHDSGILGQAGEVGERDRHWHRARRRWLDDARADGTFTTPEAAPTPVTPAGPASEQEALSQLAGILLGAPAGEATDGTADTAAPAGGPAIDLTSRRESVEAPAETSGGSSDDAYLERSRSAAARRGHGDGDDAPAAVATPATPSATRSAGSSAAAGGAEEKPKRAPLLEEGGFQVPSPFLRAALSRLATSGAPAAE